MRNMDCTDLKMISGIPVFAHCCKLLAEDALLFYLCGEEVAHCLGVLEKGAEPTEKHSGGSITHSQPPLQTWPSMAFKCGFSASSLLSSSLVLSAWPA